MKHVLQYVNGLAVNSIIMSGIAPKQNAFKFKIAPHKQKFIVNILLAGRCPPHPLVNGNLCLSTPKHNGKSGTVQLGYITTFHILDIQVIHILLFNQSNYTTILCYWYCYGNGPLPKVIGTVVGFTYRLDRLKLRASKI